MKHCAKYAADIQLHCPVRHNWVKLWLNRRDLSHIGFLPDVVPRYTNQLEESRQADLGMLGARWTGFVSDGTD